MPPSIHKPLHSSWDGIGGESKNLLKTIRIIRQMCGAHRQQLHFLSLLSPCHADQVKDTLVTQVILHEATILGLLLPQQAGQKGTLQRVLLHFQEPNHLCVVLWFPRCISACPTRSNFIAGGHIHALFNKRMVLLTEMAVDLWRMYIG